MKKILLLFLLLSYSCFGQKQGNYLGFNSATTNNEITNLQGSWKINQLIVNDKIDEYILYPQNIDDNRFSYGNNISIKPDGTFRSAYSAPCGNDCFTSSTGQYKMIDKNYICFYLEQVTQSGDCSGNSTPNIDLGLYRIYQEENKIVLRRSNGDPQQDKKNLQYIDMLTAKYNEFSTCFNLQSFLKWSTTKQFTEAIEIAAFCMAQNQIEDYEVLYDRSFQRTNLILLKIENKFRYVLYEGELRHGIRVALLDDDFFENADSLVLKIDQDKSLKPTTIKDDYDYWRNPLSKNTLIVYKKKDQIQKIIYNIYNRENKYFKETFYFKENQPNIIKIEPPTGEHFSYYVFDWKNMSGAVMKPTVQNWSFSGVMQYYHQFMLLVEKIK